MQSALGSYLGYPRVHFAGQFRADTDTRNNARCNYRMDKELDDDLNGDWGFNGTNEFQFFDVGVTSVVYQDGTTSDTDSIIGRNIIGNLKRPFAKLTDLDTDIQDHSTIYGLNFGIAWDDWDDSEDKAFYGKWTTSVIAQCMWPRLKCYSRDNPGSELFQDSFPLGAQATSRITDIDWSNVGDSQALADLQTAAAANGGDLQVRISIHYYTRNYPTYVPYNATLGYVVGVIGIPSERDTLNVPGQRAMSFVGFPIGLTFEEGDLCYGKEDDITQFGPWMYTAPFEVDTENGQVHLDISNSVSSTLDNSLRNIGTLRVGVLVDDCIQILLDEDIPYDDSDLLPVNSGIYDITLDATLLAQLDDYPLVMGQYLSDSTEGTAICGEFLSTDDTSHSMNIMLQESEYFVRPNGYYVDRLDRTLNPSSTMELYVTRYGQPAQVNVEVQSGWSFLPPNGIIPSSSTATSDGDGIATFEFVLQDTIPEDRLYGTQQCTEATDPSNGFQLPIEGQVYNFTFCVSTTDIPCQTTDINFAFLAFSDVDYSDSTPNWVDNVEPILAQFARLAPIMDTILDMGSYADVTKSHNINLMRETLLLDFDDPSYMPTTRDLSPANRDMILTWLDNPIYNSQGDDAPLELSICKAPTISEFISDYDPVILNRCETGSLQFNDNPEVVDTFFRGIHTPPDTKTRGAPLGRPLFRRALRSLLNPEDDDTECTLPLLKQQLQTAVQLEWATIPTYLTSLYSIVDGCNTEIYELIRGVIMQEMLHFTQAANILIAIGGSPLIDDASVTPTYPTHLPGDVLPRLRVTAKKVSLPHIHNVFMAIELPRNTEVGGEIDNDLYTIGALYEEVSTCIEELGDSVFDPTTLPQQVQWPWNADEDVGTVYPILNSVNATSAIDSIVSQGEGADPLDPNDIEGNTLAHFFQFEEIVCQRHLAHDEETNTYSYTGLPIPFNENGVWPMRRNPRASNILNNTNCLTETKLFHLAYRNMLRKLQEVFSGSPDEIFNAVSMMESLQVHAKRLMWTRFRPDDPTDLRTCGPVWDYDIDWSDIETD